jgi:oligopeptide transport system substrate-binding protein
MLLSLSLSGCTVSKSGGGTSGSASGETGATTASGGAGDTLRIALVFEPTTFDPAKVQDVVTSELLAHIAEPLVRFNETNLPEPALASKWDLSPDRKTYTFTIRPEAKFTNGRGVTADDIKYTWERALAPKTASTVAANYLDGIVGVKEVVAGKRPDLEGVTVVDAHTLKVTLDRPRAYFLGMLSYPTSYVVCKEAIERNGGTLDATSLIGTGPYKLASYKPGVGVNLDANADYWGGAPKTAHIEMPVILEAETSHSNFETGRIDMWMAAIPGAVYSQDKQSGKFAGEYHEVPTAQIDYLVMHQKLQPEFAKKEVREAIALAIDRDTILRVAYSGVGHRADGFLPPELPGSGETPPPIPYDPARARQLLAQAGYPNGKGFPTLTLIYRSKGAVAPQACQLIKNNLKTNLGIDVELQEREAAAYFDDAEHDKLAFYYAGWVADYPDPQDFLSTLFMSDASLNHYGYNSPQFDALCREADATSDPAVRGRLYGQANRKLVAEDFAILPIAFTPRVTLVQSNVTGWRANLCNILPNTQTVKAAH